MTIEILLDRLDGVKSRGKNKWIAKCCAHDDKSPSLALTELSDGRILIKCFAGCETQTILANIGLTMEDLFPNGRLGEFKGFQRIEDELKQKRKTSYAQTILDLAKIDRASGKRLSQSDLEIERQAYLKVRHANS